MVWSLLRNLGLVASLCDGVGYVIVGRGRTDVVLRGQSSVLRFAFVKIANLGSMKSRVPCVISSIVQSTDGLTNRLYA